MKPELLAALIAVESSGNDLAIGDGGKAIGPLQIHRGVVADVNRVVRGNYRWSEMTNRVVATKVADIYLTHWSKRIGRPVTDQDLARVWNGGPNGWKRRKTVAYWKRVQARMGTGGTARMCAPLVGGTDPRQ